jgi:putative two-component system response regulator
MADVSRSSILIVDDNPDNLTVLSALLLPDYRVRAATTGEKALSIAASLPPPDLILLDVMLPDLDGYQVFARLREQPATADIPVIFVTAMDSVEAELQGLEAGAVDYISKPIVPSLVLARVRAQLELKLARDRLRGQNAWLEAEVTRRMADNELIQTVAIRALAHLAETRDPETGNHILRTQSYVHELAQGLRRHPDYGSVMDDAYVSLLTRSAPLHDIGKVGIPDHILLKPGPLTAEEWEIMKTHSCLGADAIELAERDAERPVAFLSLAKEIARWHHERWDGGGYPDGLACDAIPISARVMAIADVYDALVTPRSYKATMTFGQAREIIAGGRGSHFDPVMVDAFLDSYDRFVVIAQRHRDGS